jgi:5-(carboxyamino)imidazole ribonucleotide mutase
MSVQPLVGLVMGSDSDWPVMELAAQALEEFGVPFEADVVSAHRMPQEMIAYGQNAAERGLRVVIAGAGGAAHLPGMLAAVTPLPVIGVPVATVSIGGARNAGLLAVRILGAGEGQYAADLREQMTAFQAALRDQARAKGAALRDRQRPGVVS